MARCSLRSLGFHSLVAVLLLLIGARAQDKQFTPETAKELLQQTPAFADLFQPPPPPNTTRSGSSSLQSSQSSRTSLPPGSSRMNLPLPEPPTGQTAITPVSQAPGRNTSSAAARQQGIAPQSRQAAQPSASPVALSTALSNATASPTAGSQGSTERLSNTTTASRVTSPTVSSGASPTASTAESPAAASSAATPTASFQGSTVPRKIEITRARSPTTFLLAPSAKSPGANSSLAVSSNSKSDSPKPSVATAEPSEAPPPRRSTQSSPRIAPPPPPPPPPRFRQRNTTQTRNATRAAAPAAAASPSLIKILQDKRNPITASSANSSTITKLLTRRANAPAPAPTIIEANVTEALAATNTARQTSVAAEIEIQGDGSTPFSINNQNLLINAYSSVMTTVTRADFSIRYFTSDSEKLPNFSASKRRLLSLKTKTSRKLLQDLSTQPLAVYANTVYVTMQINAGSNNRVGAVIGDVQASMAVSGPYNVVPVQEALQAYGQPNWSLTLLSLQAIDPAQPLNVELLCNRKFGSFCLDNTSLSQGEVKAIIACGCIFLVLLFSTICVIVDIKRRSGRMGELEMAPETPRTPMQQAVNSITTYIRSSLTAVRTPQHRAQKASRNASPSKAAPNTPASPVTATVEIAEGKPSIFKGAHQGTTLVIETSNPGAETGKQLPAAPQGAIGNGSTAPPAVDKGRPASTRPSMNGGSEIEPVHPERPGSKPPSRRPSEWGENRGLSYPERDANRSPSRRPSDVGERDAKRHWK